MIDIKPSEKAEIMYVSDSPVLPSLKIKIRKNTSTGRPIEISVMGKTSFVRSMLVKLGTLLLDLNFKKLFRSSRK
jgi:hypothetical protein